MNQTITRIKKISMNSTVQLVVLLFFGLFLRLWFASMSDLWLDETFSVVQSAKPLLEVLTLNDNTPPTFYVLLHFWLKLGTEQIIIRLFTILLGLGTVAALWLAKEKTAAFLFTIWPTFIEQNAEVRTYSLLIGAIVLHVLVARSKKEQWVLGFFSALLCMYAHIYGIFYVMAAQIFTWKRKGWKWYVGQAVAFFFWALWAFWRYNTVDSDTVSWIPLTNLQLIEQTGYWLSSGSAWTGIGQVFFIGSIIFLLAYMRRWQYVVWAVSPIVIGMIIGVFIPFYTAKYVVASAAGFLLSVRRVPWFVLGFIAILGISTMVMLGVTERNLPWQDIVVSDRPIYYTPAGAVYPLLFHGEQSCLGVIDEYACMRNQGVYLLNGRTNPCSEDELLYVFGLQDTPPLVIESSITRYESHRQWLTVQTLDCSQLRGPMRSVR